MNACFAILFFIISLPGYPFAILYAAFFSPRKNFEVWAITFGLIIWVVAIMFLLWRYVFLLDKLPS